MHQRLIVASSQDAKDFDVEGVIPFNSKNSHQVSAEVEQWLNENAFASEGGRWTASPADWFVIGGRWSGELDKLENGIEWKDMVSHLKSLLSKEELEQYDERFVNSNHTKTHCLALNEWWQKKTDTDALHPWCRDSYNISGELDSRPLSKKLWKAFKDEGLGEHQTEEGWIMIDRWVRHDDNAKSTWYDDSIKWIDLKDKAIDVDPDDFLAGEAKPDDQIWLTVVDYHY